MLNDARRTTCSRRQCSRRYRIARQISWLVGWPGDASVAEGRYANAWRPLPMALSCFLAALLTVSWLFEPGRGFWNQLDVMVFRALNNTLAWGGSWQNLWAIANWRPFDLIAGTAVCLVLWGTLRHAFRDRLVSGLGSLAVLVTTMIAVKFASELLIEHVLAYHRPSPTKVLGDTWRLSTLVTWIKCKDSSPWCFPGDHGFVLLMSVIYVAYFGNRKLLVSAALIATMGILPRLVGGAHWLTDIVIGSGTMALVASAFVFATPAHDWIVEHSPRFSKRGQSQAMPSPAARAA